MIALLHSGTDEVRRNSSWAVAVCAVDEQTASEVCRLGGMSILQEIQVSGTRRNPFADVALQNLLNSNLSAKYSLTGHLSSTNLIQDGFYDAGQMRPGSQFLSLEDYCKQELHDKRPVLFVNAKPDPVAKESQSQNDVDTAKDNSKTNVSGKSSRTGRDTKAPSPPKSKAQKEKEEKQKEEELQAQLQKEAETQPTTDNKPFEMPCDSNLFKYLEEITEKIQPLPTTREQVVALAQYVSEHMGGPIEKGQLANFSWELPISQVRFELKSNVVPIGKIKSGIHIHRALLFKVLADRIAVGCTLNRGEYNLAWNEVMLPDSDDTPGAPKFPPRTFVVDLVHEPGKLLRADSPDAVKYQKL